ncbi:ABC transporter permease [Actinotalea subterranea]|uniref:ABC transporter permease n=1 Tax=Actinotalea subterranea TaxID=2607497 RepID=UPI0011ED4EF2|nr:ABC transporter permease [Actinotalea subterranea]
MNGARQALLLAQWQLRRQSTMLPLLVVVQTAIAVATVVGYGLLVGDPPPEVAVFLATGAPTVTLISVGLVMTPQMLAQSKLEGSLDWMRTLPVPRVVFLLSDLAVWTLLALPGMVLGVVAGVMRFDLELSVAPWILVAVLVISLTAASVGYGMASVLPPALAMIMTQLLIFVVLLFSPISYPAERMPDWLQQAHEVLPIEPMAQLMRAGLVDDTFSVPGRSLVVLAAWTAVSVGGALMALRRRA